jgi:hypothetical protein
MTDRTEAQLLLDHISSTCNDAAAFEDWRHMQATGNQDNVTAVTPLTRIW